MNPTVLTAVSAAALVLALAVAIGLAVQSRRLRRLRDELVTRNTDVACLRSELDTARLGGPVAAEGPDRSEVARPEVPRPRVATSPTAWRRARAGGAVRTRRSVSR
ncbi:MAG: hypothetical protein ABW212_05525 [Pseudonocardia sediminis]